MDKKRSAILVGGFIETIELLLGNEIDIRGIIDLDSDRIPAAYREQVQYFGGDNLLADPAFMDQYKDIPRFLSPDVPAIRRKLYELYGQQCTFLNVISKKAHISPTARLQDNASTMIQDLVNISANVTIGRCVRINTCANVMHDCTLGDFVTVAPNAVLLGAVSVGEGAYIGANATVLSGITIGKNAMVGAGAVVTRDVTDHMVVIGNPARKLQK